MNIIQTNHRPIAYEFVLLLLLLLLVLLCCCYYCCYCCYLSCSAAATTIATAVTCLALLLLLLLLSLATVATCYCCHYCCSLPLLLLVTLPIPATSLLLLCLQILIFQVWLNLTNSAANTWEYTLTSRRANQQIGSNTLPSKTAANPRAGGPSTTFFQFHCRGVLSAFFWCRCRRRLVVISIRLANARDCAITRLAPKSHYKLKRA